MSEADHGWLLERIAMAGDDGIVLALEAATPVALARVDGIQIRPVRVLNL